MNKLYKFSANFGRMGKLSGIFVQDEDLVSALMGKSVYFGEALGKHSEIDCKITTENLTALTDDQSFISKFLQFKCESGTNPFDYFEPSDVEEEDDAEAR